MKKFLTLRRSMFLGAFVALAVIATATLLGSTTVRTTAQESAMVSSDDMASVESSSSYSVSSGSYSGGEVTFGLSGASVSSATVADGMAAEGVAYTEYAGCVAEGVAEGAASASYVTVDTSGYSLPLQNDTYLPVYVSGTYSGTDVYADTAFNGTVLAYAGFSTSNPNFELSDSGSSVVTYYADDGGGGGGGGCSGCDYEVMRASLDNSFSSYFMPASFMPATLAFGGAAKDKNKDKSYKLAFRKQSGGVPALTSGTVKKWKSNVPGTENLKDISLVIESNSIQYDAASGTLNFKQKFRIKKAKK